MGSRARTCGAVVANPVGVRVAVILLAAWPVSAFADDAAVHVDVDVDIDLEPPGMIVPAPAPPPPRHELELATHVGVLHAAQSYDIGTGFDQPGPHGTSLMFDVSAGTHLRPWLAVAGFGALSSIDSRAGYYQNTDVRDAFMDLGVEARLYAEGAFVGGLAGFEEVRSSFDGADHWATGELGGLEVGYTGRAHGGVAPEIVLAATYTTIGTTEGFYWEGPAGGSIVGARASVGARF